MYKNLEIKKQILLDYIRKNQNTTYRKIRRDTKIKVERIFPGMMKEAWEAAGVPFSKSLSKRTKDEQRTEVIDFIRKNQKCTTTELQNATRVSISKVFGSIASAYDKSGVNYPKFSKLEDAIKFVKQNPLASSTDIQKKCKIDIFKYFKSMKDFYKKISVTYINGHKKRSIKIQNKIIQYIKSNPNSTQWEINKNCNTHVQEIFSGGIKEAYEKAGINYPKERRENYGAADKKIKNRALKFEDEIITLLNSFGKVKKYVKTNVGIADALINIKDKNYAVEIKDYKSKPISLSDIKQLNKYIESIPNCNCGLLICRTKGKEDKFYIGRNKVFIITKEDLLSGNVA